jgi:hypothetical protein
MPQHCQLSTAEYEQRLMLLLEKVGQGCGAEQVQAALAGVDEQWFCEWLWHWGTGLTLGEHPELATRLGRLAEIERGKVGVVARELSQQLLLTVSSPNSSRLENFNVRFSQNEEHDDLENELLSQGGDHPTFAKG